MRGVDMPFGTIGEWTPTGAIIAVLALPYLMIALGRLQPRKNIEDWRDAYFKSEQRHTERDAMMRDLVEQGETVLAVLRSFPERESP